MHCADLRWLCHVREELPLVRACIQHTGEAPMCTNLLKLPTFRVGFHLNCQDQTAGTQLLNMGFLALKLVTRQVARLSSSIPALHVM